MNKTQGKVHGGFHNEDCKYCRGIDKAVFGLISIGIIIFGFLLFNDAWTVSPEDKIPIILSVVIALPITYLITRKINKYLPQSHGYLFDATGEQEWYKPKKAK